MRCMRRSIETVLLYDKDANAMEFYMVWSSQNFDFIVDGGRDFTLQLTTSQ